MALADGIYGVLPFVYVGWIVLGVLFLLYTRSQRPDALDAIGTSLAEGDEHGGAHTRLGPGPGDAEGHQTR